MALRPRPSPNSPPKLGQFHFGLRGQGWWRGYVSLALGRCVTAVLCSSYSTNTVCLCLLMIIILVICKCSMQQLKKKYLLFSFFSSYLISPFHFSRQMGIHTNSLGVWGSCKLWSLGEEVHWAGCWHVDLVVVTRLHFQRCWLGRKPGLFFSQGDIRGRTLILGQGSAHGWRGKEALHNKHSHLPFHA